MKINFGHFQIEMGHDYKNGSRIQKWDVNMKMGHEYEHGDNVSIFQKNQNCYSFLPAISLSCRLTGVSNNNHIGGGGMSFEDLGAAISTPN